MEETKISCLGCYHFPVCMVHEKARRIKIWNQDIYLFFQTEAQSCDYFEPVRKEDKNGGEKPKRPLS